MIFQTVDDIKNKFERIFPQGVDVRHHFEQFRATPPYGYNDNVLPPYESFGQYGFNTMDVSAGFYSVYMGVLSCPGTIVGMIDLPTTLTCSSASQPVSGYLLSNGITSGYYTGDWVSAGAVTDRGGFWYIGLIGGVHYFWIPSGFVLSADVIPDVFNYPGNYIWAKNFYGGWGGAGGVNPGMVISSWDGSFRYGKIASFWDAPGERFTMVGTMYAPSILSDLRKNGVSPVVSLAKDTTSNINLNEPLSGLFSNYFPLRDEPFGLNVAVPYLCQFDGYLITPKNSASNFSPSYSLNTI